MAGRWVGRADRSNYQRRNRKPPVLIAPFATNPHFNVHTLMNDVLKSHTPHSHNLHTNTVHLGGFHFFLLFYIRKCGFLVRVPGIVRVKLAGTDGTINKDNTLSSARASRRAGESAWHIPAL